MAASTSMRPALKSSSKARRASLSTVRFRRSLQQEIRAARLEAGEIERHVDVAELAQENPDLVLPQLGFDQGRAHAPVLRGLHARAVVAAVVHVGAVHEGATSFTLGDRRQLEEELFLAEEAPVRRIARVVRILE